MGILDRLKAWYKKAPRRFVWIEGSGHQIPEWTGTYEDFKKGVDPGIEYIDHKLLRDYYKKCEWIRACVDALINETMARGWEFYPEDEKKTHKRVIEKLTDWFKHPNEQDTDDELLRMLLVDWIVTGDAFLELTPNKAGMITDLWVLDPQYMRIKVNEHGIIQQYVQRIHGKDVNFYDPKEIIHWKYQTTSDRMFGLSPMETLLQTAAGDLVARDYNNKFFQNAATPRLHVDLGEGVELREVKEFMEYWNKEFKGKPFKNIFTGGGAVIKEISFTNTDMQYMEYQKMNATKIMSVFGVPPIQIGVVEQSNRFNAREQREIWKETRVQPLQRRFSEGINKILDRMGIMNVRFRFVGLDKPDELREMKISSMKLKMGLITINEWRAEQGLGSVEWGDEPIILQNKGSPDSAGEEGLAVQQEPEKDRDVEEN